MERKVNKRTFKIDEGRVRNGSAFHAPVTSDICYISTTEITQKYCDLI